MNRCAPSAVFIALTMIIIGCGPKKSIQGSAHSGSIEKKYAALLQVDENDIDNVSLYRFIDEWYGTPYKYGGKSKSGVDCSGFTSILLKEIYDKELSGSSASLYDQCRRTAGRNLQEGDLVFFKIDSKQISHVGVYLQNNRFVHATTRAGVMINSLDEDYYRNAYWGGGTVK